MTLAPLARWNEGYRLNFEMRSECELGGFYRRASREMTLEAAATRRAVVPVVRVEINDPRSHLDDMLDSGIGRVEGVDEIGEHLLGFVCCGVVDEMAGRIDSHLPGHEHPSTRPANSNGLAVGTTQNTRHAIDAHSARQSSGALRRCHQVN